MLGIILMASGCLAIRTDLKQPAFVTCLQELGRWTVLCSCQHHLHWMLEHLSRYGVLVGVQKGGGKRCMSDQVLVEKKNSTSPKMKG